MGRIYVLSGLGLCLFLWLGQFLDPWLGGRHGLLLGFFVGLAFLAHTLTYVRRNLSKLFLSRELRGQDPFGLVSSLQKHCAQLQMPPPRLFLVSGSNPLAFAAGLKAWDHSLWIAESLVKLLPQGEIDALLLCFCLRWKKNETQKATLISAWFRGPMWIANKLDASFLPLRFMLGVQWQPFSLLAGFCIFIFAKGMFFGSKVQESDRLPLQYKISPETLASLLTRLQNYGATLPVPIAYSESFLFLVNPLTHAKGFSYFMIQPSLQVRVRSLLGRYPI